MATSSTQSLVVNIDYVNISGSIVTIVSPSLLRALIKNQDTILREFSLSTDDIHIDKHKNIIVKNKAFSENESLKSFAHPQGKVITSQSDLAHEVGPDWYRGPDVNMNDYCRVIS
jgi:hypothetical protein